MGDRYAIVQILKAMVNFIIIYFYSFVCMYFWDFEWKKKYLCFFLLNRFSIDSHNGQLFVACNNNRCLDREQQSVYHFTVEARDGGGKVSSAFVDITLLDQNDNVPIFMHSKYEFGITENSILISGSDNISVHVSF